MVIVGSEAGLSTKVVPVAYWGVAVKVISVSVPVPWKPAAPASFQSWIPPSVVAKSASSEEVAAPEVQQLPQPVTEAKVTLIDVKVSEFESEPNCTLSTAVLLLEAFNLCPPKSGVLSVIVVVTIAFTLLVAIMSRIKATIKAKPAVNLTLWLEFIKENLEKNTDIKIKLLIKKTEFPRRERITLKIITLKSILKNRKLWITQKQKPLTKSDFCFWTKLDSIPPKHSSSPLFWLR